VVVHLAGIPDEAPFADILESNIVGTYNVFEAAREAAVRRVVFASSHHVVGFYPTNQTVDPDMPPRPDTYYGVSKVTGEALGRLYHDKWGLEVINIRIGAFRDQPTLPRHQSVWLSVNDASRLVASAVTAPGIGYLTVFGVSANTASWWDSQGGYRLLGFTPRDDASLVTSGTSEAETHHGGVYTDPEYWGGSG
jgi:uronate dehydrogenase